MKFYIYKDGVSEWRWFLATYTKKMIAASCQGYKERADCIAAINIVRGGALSAGILEANPE